MKLSSKFIGLATILFFLTSCYQWVPYSTRIQEQYHLSVRDLEGTQFYLSHPIRLYKATTENAAPSVDGKLVIDNNKHSEQIILKAGTKGVFINGTAFKMAVSFEVGEGRFLIFGSSTKDGRFKLQAQSWENNHGLLKYAGQDYFAEPGSGKAHLLIKMKKMREVERKGRSVKGRTVQ